MMRALVAVAAIAAIAAANVLSDDAPFLTYLGEDIRTIGQRTVKSVSDTLPPRADINRVNETSLFVTMRDGVQLWTVISVPEDIGLVGTVLVRSSYGTASCGGASWIARGFAFICQVRLRTPR